MPATRLRIYRGHEAPKQDEAAPAAGRAITTTVGAVLPLLADAIRSERTWLRDFEDDELTISADLYEVLMAYQYFRRPVA